MACGILHHQLVIHKEIRQSPIHSEYTDTACDAKFLGVCEALNYVRAHKSFIIRDSLNRAINKTHPITSFNKTCRKQLAPTLFPNQPWGAVDSFLSLIKKKDKKKKSFITSDKLPWVQLEKKREGCPENNTRLLNCLQEP